MTEAERALAQPIIDQRSERVEEANQIGRGGEAGLGRVESGVAQRAVRREVGLVCVVHRVSIGKHRLFWWLQVRGARCWQVAGR